MEGAVGILLERDWRPNRRAEGRRKVKFSKENVGIRR